MSRIAALAMCIFARRVERISMVQKSVNGKLSAGVKFNKRIRSIRVQRRMLSNGARARPFECAAHEAGYIQRRM